MSEKTPQSYIYLVRPDLIKEWHPFKNGKLNPKNVTCDYAEQAWWLCEYGHEWVATVKSRMAGDRCPVCVLNSLKEQIQESDEYLQDQQLKSNNAHFSEKSNDLFQEDSDRNYAGIEFRKYKRYKYTTTAMLEELFSEIRVQVDAQMKNISRQGMYFETNSYFEPGGKVRVIFEKPFFKSKSKNFRSAVTTVRWCIKLADEKEHSYAYGLGLQLN